MARGAQVRVPEAKGKPAADASALFFAAHSGNATILPTLRKAGDDPDSPTMMFGTFPVTPLQIATSWGRHRDTCAPRPGRQGGRAAAE